MNRSVFILLVAAGLFLLSACGGEQAPPPEAPEAEQAPAMEEMAEPTAKLNLNEATEEEFRTIPNVDDRMVGEFLEYRPYASIQQFRLEIGKYVDEAQVAAYEEYVYVPIDPNESDAETLMQIPGVDQTEAEQLIAGRPYASNDAFLQQLTGYVTAEERTAAETYLTL